MKETIIKEDLLFHSVHGLCRVAEITRADQSAETRYSVLPVSKNLAKVRFIIPESSMEISGFSKLISTGEANAILEYFKTGDKKDSECGQTWMLAVLVWAESYNKEAVKDKRKRQRLEHAVRGLVSELAFVLNFTLKGMAERIQKNLGAIANINPLVLTALANVERE